MASGKSSVGRALAHRRSLSFVDTDAMIVERHGSIEQIFEHKGEAEFRQMERDVATELQTSSGLVIATGGRMMLDEHCAKILGSTGRIFCLRASIEEIQRRYKADADGPVRPLLADSDESLLRRLYEERANAYSQFEQVETDGKSVGEVVEGIEMMLSHG
ncbi:MAG TPA: shikimate kinase [Acidimicrobiaceae bacterium]|nr:shikimate kinase [Acidimicrobiaceae bacterium]